MLSKKEGLIFVRICMLIFQPSTLDLGMLHFFEFGGLCNITVLYLGQEDQSHLRRYLQM